MLRVVARCPCEEHLHPSLAPYAPRKFKQLDSMYVESHSPTRHARKNSAELRKTRKTLFAVFMAAYLGAVRDPLRGGQRGRARVRSVILDWLGREFSWNWFPSDARKARWLAVCRLLQKVLFHLRGCLVLRIAASTWKAPAHVGLYPSACYVGNRPMFRRMYLNMRPVLVRHTSTCTFNCTLTRSCARALTFGPTRGCVDV